MFKGDWYWSVVFIFQCIYWRHEVIKPGLDGIITVFYLAGLVAFLKFISINFNYKGGK